MPGPRQPGPQLNATLYVHSAVWIVQQIRALLAASYGPLQVTVLASSVFLVLLAPKAATAPGLQTNDDSLAFLVGLLPFGFAAFVTIVPIGRLGEPFAAAIFAIAWLVQGFGLLWVEGDSLIAILQHSSNRALHLWVSVYTISILAVVVSAIVAVRHARQRGMQW